jgi:hypothetical protein
MVHISFYMSTTTHNIILGASVHIVQANTEALLVTSKKTGLAVNADKTKYTVMSRDQ